MATYIKTLKDNKTGDMVYPRTSDNAVTVTSDGSTLQNKLNTIETNVNTLQQQLGNANAMTLDGHNISYFATADGLNGATADIDNIQNDVGTINTQITNLSTDISDTSSNVNDLNTTITNMNTVRTATLTTTWTGASAPYTQVVNVTGITSTMTPIIDIVLSTTLATALLQETAWSYVSKAVTGTDTITFTCNRVKPTTAIPIQIKGV